MRKSGFFCGFVVAMVFACGSSNSGNGGPGGGANSIGGASTGGSVANNGGVTSAGLASTGGTSIAAGRTTTGGMTAPGGGSSAGGSVSIGGTQTTGGTVAAGGGIPVAGTTAAGADSAVSGGSQATGGTTTHGGGTIANGGTTAIGGTTKGTAPIGGAAATGGTAAAGGITGNGGSTACPALPAGPTGTKDAVAGTLISFNDNGGWCWYQDERALVDTKANKLIIGSVASGGSRDGYIEGVIYDLQSGNKQRYTLGTSLAGSQYVDDHNAPAFLIRPDGNYVAMWSSHRLDCMSRYSIFNGTSWSAEKQFDWTPLGCYWDNNTNNKITYSNLWYLDSNIYSFIRSVDTSPGVLTSTDGSSWSYYGRLTDSPQVGYVAGYYKYWGNNTDRIDFVGTEAHPRDADTSLYHGYIQGGKVYNSAGTVMDSSLKDSSTTTSNSVDISTYTPVFKTGTSLNGTPICRLWNHDIVRYADGTIAIIGQGRTNECDSTPSGSDPDKRMLYVRWDGSSWTPTYLVNAGSKLYDAEEDYTGLSALHPDNPHVIYISTTYDPRDATEKTTTPKHEIYQGTTCDNGKTWQWTPITQGSTMDNLRPIVPKWDANHTALLWLRGTYTKAQAYNFQVVGTITGP